MRIFSAFYAQEIMVVPALYGAAKWKLRYE